MIIKLTSKDEIIAALKSSLSQMNMIRSLTMDVDDSFQEVVLNLDEENQITEILNNSNWPSAVDDALIANTAADKDDRAAGIVFLFLNDDVNGKKILDFGCGDGNVSKITSDKGAIMSVGYDIQKSDVWDSYVNAPNLLLTTDFLQVTAAGPYDIIILYDVIDHTDDPIALLNQIKSVLLPNGVVQVRCHPWCSRHGGHTYRSMNKAFSHMFMSSDSVIKLSGGNAPIQKVIHPKMTYQDWFRKAGFSVVSAETVSDKVEDFFKIEPLRTKVKSLWRSSPMPDYAFGQTFPDFPMSQSFIDYVIKI
jgi:2-polyprenyl-3-methyl-5-hydroxy-6-metoxy-1,4-benzoquinol methylase